MEKRSVTLAEAAAIAGTSPDTIRRRLKRGEISRAQTNEKGLLIDLASLREAFDLPPEAGQDEGAKGAQIETALKAAVKGLEERLAEMRLSQARTETRHLAEMAGIESKLAGAQALADARQAEIERLHGMCMATAQQVPGLRDALRAWLARRLAA